MIKTDSLGNLIRGKTYGTSEDDNPYTYIAKYGTDFILTGGIDLEAGFPIDFQGYIARINGSNGNIIWSDTLGINQPGFNEVFNSNAIITPNGDVIGIGQTHFQATTGGVDGWVVKYDSNGNLLWQRSYSKYGGNNHNYFWDIQPTYDNGMVLCGDLSDFSNGNHLLWVMKLDSMGCDVVNCSVGIEEEEKEHLDVLIYPNPTSTHFTVEALNKPYHLTIYYAVGQLLYNENNILAASKIVDVNKYNNGLLFIRIEAEGEVIYRKIIKQ